MSSLRDLVKFYQQAGAKAVVGDIPFAWANLDLKPAKVEPPKPTAPSVKKPTIAPPTATPPVVSSPNQAWSAKTLDELKQALHNFEGCGLKRTAHNTVFSDGKPESGLMLIGEAPGADEDEQGLPFVGQSGQLLNAMLAAIGINRSAGDCYITNVVPWRPPGNRPPSTDEIAACRPFLDQHIVLVQPKLIVLLGGIACKTLLHEASTGAMRGRFHQYTMVNGVTVPMCVTYHPAYLLRSPRQKGTVWHDWLMIQRFLKEHP